MPKHQPSGDLMNNQMSVKFAALAVALAINGALLGSVAYLFSGRFHDTSMVQALSQAPVAAMIHV
jgi:uncharacterized membrane protein YjfL (UPF0719 family)